MPALKQAVAASWTTTLRLPKSLFPPRPVLADRPRYIKQCCDELYDWQRTAAPPRKDEFVLHDGPPYANGALHVGHALNKILKDITCRTRLLGGQRVNYVPGWDCHGLPIELKALQQQREEKKGEVNALGAAETRRVASSLAAKTVEEQKAGFRRWAIMADWDNAWRTTTQKYELGQLRVFKDMLQRGLIYQQHKPVYWSPSSRTALAEAELEYRPDHPSTAAFVKFALHNIPAIFRDVVNGNDTVVHAAIWTTTPWTLVANRAIAFHEALQYSLVQSAQHGLLLIASSRLPDLEKTFGEDLTASTLKTVLGKDLRGIVYTNALEADPYKVHPFLHGDFVSSDSGTGLVHVAPGHGMDDYKLCQANGIGPYAPVDDVGCFTDEASPQDPEVLMGQVVLEGGNRTVLELLKSRKLLIHSHVYHHSYPYDWRSKQPVIIRATRQWFANVGTIREAALESLSNVEFIPDGGKERLSSLVRSRTEWCISRQRPWGVPIPALYDISTQEALMTPETVEHIMIVMKERGSDAWWTDDPSDLLWIPPSFRDTGPYYRGHDTMDVWFDSGTSWTQMQSDKHEQRRAADVYLEGKDQHRGWFQSSLLTRIASHTRRDEYSSAEAPFKKLVTHGFALDQHGRKMSKSIGNVIEPEEIMQGTLLPPLKRKRGKSSPEAASDIRFDALGPDALRMWVAASDYTRDVVISVPVLQAVNNSISKLRVTFKLLLGFLDIYQSDTKTSFGNLELNDQHILVQLQRLCDTVDNHFRGFEYSKAVSAINHFVTADLSAGYVESIKDRMYTDAVGSSRRVHSQIVVWQIFQRLADILFPITPLLVEEACNHLPGQLSYHPVRHAWRQPTTQEAGVMGAWQSERLDMIMPYLDELNANVKALQEEARSKGKMGSSLQSEVILHTPSAPHMRVLLQNQRAAVEDMLVVSRFEVSSEPVSEMRPETEWYYSRTIQVNGESANLMVSKPLRAKCARCWKYNVPKEHKLEDRLCIRCVGVLEAMRGDHPHVFAEKPRLDAAARSCRDHSDPELRAHWSFDSITRKDVL